MKKKLLLVVVLILSIIFTIFGCAKKTLKSDDSIIENVLQYFQLLTQIPRPSYHEEEISEYMYNWAKERKFEAFRDKANNVIVDVPATKGMEKVPAVILQCHLDMVFAAKDGLNLDPLTTKINMIVNGEDITSDGNTSLGADDGIGVAIAMSVAEGYVEHGPLRLLFTTTEEEGMKGAFAADPNIVKDYKYMINLDAEESESITVSSAGGWFFDINNVYNQEIPKYDKAYEIELKGCEGGHSGFDIIYGKANAIIELAKIIFQPDYNFEIASFNGGVANNAIPTSAKAVVVFNIDVEKILQDKFNIIKEKYKETDPDISLNIKEVEIPNKVINEKDSKNVLSFACNVIDGVYTWSKDTEKFPESSSNLGVVECNDGNLQYRIFARSSNKDMLLEIDNLHKSNAKKCNIINVSTYETAKAWKYVPNNKLLEISQNAYKEILGKDPKIEMVHAGLECGTFAEYNPNMNIISIGPDVNFPHTIKETLKKSSIPKLFRALEKILKNIE